MKSNCKKIFEKIWTTLAIMMISGLQGKAYSFKIADDDRKET